jgi:hypothetical protein
MTKEEFDTAITMMRNKHQARISIAKSFLTPEQMKVFRSRPFVAERADKPRWNFGVEPHEMKKRKKHTVRSITRKDVGNIELPVGQNGCVLGKKDYLHHTKVTMAQILRILNGDHTAHYREIPPRKGYSYVNKADEIV